MIHFIKAPGGPGCFIFYVESCILNRTANESAFPPVPEFDDSPHGLIPSFPLRQGLKISGAFLIRSAGAGRDRGILGHTAYVQFLSGHASSSPSPAN